MLVNMWGQAHSINDLPCIKPVVGGVAIQFIEVSQPHGKVGLANSLVASASMEPVNRLGTSVRMTASCCRLAKMRAQALSAFTSMRLR